MAAGRRRVAAAVLDLRLGTRGDGRQFTRLRHIPRSVGLTALERGDEAILRPAGFQVVRPGGVRQAVTRARRAGLTVRIRRHRDIAEDEMARAITRADSWRDTETERSFRWRWAASATPGGT